MAKITLERASEMVSALRELCPAPDTKATDLFDYFVDTLGIESQTALEEFAELCGFLVATDVEIVPGTFLPWGAYDFFSDNESNGAA